ncbi:hypothetical protein [Phenylobacterium sp.]|uniref:hypothetical protein n=1 Tax=Phenylobacterium sp. TaxID=1871053 RepID=UPI00120FAEB0|nr:hypothetical protein [Phenylobacterium sp.]THD56240.1 MAG: hypothetical protein E8A12_14875 [Phenylobacterium sp.]
MIAHVAAIFFWLRDVGPSRFYPDPPTMNVELVRSWPAQPRARLAERSRSAALQAGAPTASPGDARPSSQAPLRPDAPRDVQPGARADSGLRTIPSDEDAAAVRTLLQGVLGCSHQALLRMSASEREACDEKLAAARQGDRDRRYSQLNLDKRGAFAASKMHEPLLARTPKNGCVPHVQEDEIGALGIVRPEWTASVGCALSF